MSEMDPQPDGGARGEQRSALITGGSRGIGLALARLLAADGWRLALLARGAGELERAASDLRARRVTCLALPADVSDGPAVSAAVSRAWEELGALSLVVHCAGLLATGRHDEIGIEEYRRLMEVNYIGAVNVSRAALALMRARGEGHLALVCSVVAFRTFPGFAAYAPTKWALRAFHETLEMEMRGSPLSLSIVYPPITDTEMVRSIPPSRRPAVYTAFRPQPTDRIAAAIYRGLRAGKSRVFARRRDWLLFHLQRLAPGTTGGILDWYIARSSARPGPLHPGDPAEEGGGGRSKVDSGTGGSFTGGSGVTA